MRYLELTDFVTITCVNCGSTNVDLIPEYCEQCGNVINSRCNNCGLEHEYHNFEQVEE